MLIKQSGFHVFVDKIFHEKKRNSVVVVVICRNTEENEKGETRKGAK